MLTCNGNPQWKGRGKNTEGSIFLKLFHHRMQFLCANVGSYILFCFVRWNTLWEELIVLQIWILHIFFTGRLFNLRELKYNVRPCYMRSNGRKEYMKVVLKYLQAWGIKDNREGWNIRPRAVTERSVWYFPSTQLTFAQIPGEFRQRRSQSAGPVLTATPSRPQSPQVQPAWGLHKEEEFLLQ